MALVSKPYTFTVGATIVASEHNSNFDIIYADYNGNITDANISASASISYSKLSLSGSITSSDLTTALSRYLVPSGGIIMWSGTIATIPSGWYLCNGSNGTPDLRNLFIVGADADSGGVAKSTITGSALQSHATGLVLDHTHTYTAVQAPGAGNSGGALDTAYTATTGGVNSGNSASKNIAPFYALAFIMKS